MTPEAAALAVTLVVIVSPWPTLTVVGVAVVVWIVKGGVAGAGRRRPGGEADRGRAAPAPRARPGARARPGRLHRGRGLRHPRRQGRRRGVGRRQRTAVVPARRAADHFPDQGAAAVAAL